MVRIFLGFVNIVCYSQMKIPQHIISSCLCPVGHLIASYCRVRFVLTAGLQRRSIDSRGINNAGKMTIA